MRRGNASRSILSGVSAIHSERSGNTFDPNGYSIASSRPVSSSEASKRACWLEHIRGRRLGCVVLERRLHPLVPTILLWVSRLNALELNAQVEPLDPELPEPVERMLGGKGTPLSVRMISERARTGVRGVNGS